jgi:low temperature requirement protein LtrA
MTSAPEEVRGGTGRSADTIELFFDLVYVFAITQVVGLIHRDPTLTGLAKGAFVLFLLWWTWSIYTWTTNWSGTGSPLIKMFLLATMATTLVMAMAVPEAFGESSTLFGITYFVVRVLAAGLYWFESKEYPAQRAAFLTFFPGSIVASLFVLIGGLVQDTALLVLFLIGGAGDVISAVNAGRGNWAVDAPHFAERNGLFIIIALGESIVGIGLTATAVDLDPRHVVALMIAFAGVATLWWSYFDRAAPQAEHQFSRLTGQPRGRFARDVYTLIHYPLVVGIVLFAVGLEDVVAHPGDVLDQVARITIAGGTALVMVSLAAVTLRAMGRVAPERVAASFGLAALVWVGSDWTAVVFAAVSVGVTMVALVLESSRPWLEPGEPPTVRRDVRPP